MDCPEHGGRNEASSCDAVHALAGNLKPVRFELWPETTHTQQAGEPYLRVGFGLL